MVTLALAKVVACSPIPVCSVDVLGWKYSVSVANAAKKKGGGGGGGEHGITWAQ